MRLLTPPISSGCRSGTGMHIGIRTHAVFTHAEILGSMARRESSECIASCFVAVQTKKATTIITIHSTIEEKISEGVHALRMPKISEHLRPTRLATRAFIVLARDG